MEKNFLWQYYLIFIAAIFMIIGIVLSFFYIHWGGLFVGLALGIAFFDEFYNSFLKLRGYYSAGGIFKTLMLIGLVIYLLIAVPMFVIAFFVGFFFIFLIHYTLKKLK